MKSAKKTFEENLHNFGSGVVDEVLHGSGHHRGVDEIQERRHPVKKIKHLLHEEIHSEALIS